MPLQLQIAHCTKITYRNAIIHVIGVRWIAITKIFSGNFFCSKCFNSKSHWEKIENFFSIELHFQTFCFALGKKRVALQHKVNNSFEIK